MNSDSNWTSPTRSLFTVDTPGEPQHSRPPPRAARSSLNRSENSTDAGRNCSSEDSFRERSTAHVSLVRSPSCGDAQRSRSVPQSPDLPREAAANGSREARRTGNRPSASVLSLFASANKNTRTEAFSSTQQHEDGKGLAHLAHGRNGSANGTFLSINDAGTATNHKNHNNCTFSEPSGVSSTFVTRQNDNQTMRPSPLSANEGLPSAAAALNRDIEEVGEAVDTAHGQRTRQGPSTRHRTEPQRRKKRRAYTTQPWRENPMEREEPAPLAVHPGDVAGVAEADKIFRRIGYSLITEAVRLQAARQGWRPARVTQVNGRGALGGGDCQLEYTYLDSPSTAPSRRPSAAAAEEDSRGGIPLYRATLDVRCSLDTLATVLAEPESTTHYIFNARFHRVVALCDGGRGCLQHTGFVTQPPTDVVGFHYMRLMAIDREYAKASSSQLSTTLCEALDAYLRTCTPPGPSRAAEPADRRTFHRPPGSPTRVLVCSSTSVEDPRVPLQWGYTRCRVHLSAIVAHDSPTPGTITLHYLYAQDPRDQHEGVPGPTGGDHSIPAMLSQRALNLRAYCCSKEAEGQKRQTQRNRRGGRSAKLGPARFTVSTGSEWEDSGLGSTGAAMSSPRALPRNPTYLPYYRAVWSRIRDREESARARRHEAASLSGAAASETQQRSEALYHMNHGAAVMVSSSPEPRPPWRAASASPLPRPTTFHPPPTQTQTQQQQQQGEEHSVGALPLHKVNPAHGHHRHTTSDIDNCSAIANVAGYDDVSVQQQSTANNTPRVPHSATAQGEALSIVRESRVSRQPPLSQPRSRDTGTTPSATTGTATGTPSTVRDGSRRERFEREAHGPDSVPRVTRRAVERISPVRRQPRTRAQTVKLKPRVVSKVRRARTVSVAKRQRRVPSPAVTRAVRVDLVSCKGLPESPFKRVVSGEAVGNTTLLHVSVRTSADSFHGKTRPVPYAVTVNFDVGQAAFVIPVASDGADVRDVVTFTAVASRKSGVAADAPLLRMGEAEVSLGNLRSGRSHELDVPLVGRAATKQAKERAILRCVLTPTRCGVSQERLLTRIEEEEVRSRCLRVLREQHPEQLHRLECYVGEARGLRLPEALRAVEALGQPEALASTSQRSTGTSGVGRGHSPVNGVFERRQVQKYSSRATSGSSHRRSPHSHAPTVVEGRVTQAVVGKEEEDNPAAAPGRPSPTATHGATQQQQQQQRQQTRKRSNTTARRGREDGGGGQEGKRAPRARTAPAAAGTRRSKTQIASSPPQFPSTVSLASIRVDDLVCLAPDGLTCPPLLNSEECAFVEVVAVSRTKGVGLPYVAPAVTRAQQSTEHGAHGSKHLQLRFPQEALTLDVSPCAGTEMEPALRVSVWTGLPSCRVNLLGSCEVSLRTHLGTDSSQRKKLPLVRDASAPAGGTVSGTVSFTLRVTQRSRAPGVGLSAQDTPKEASLCRALTSYLSAHRRKELHRLDIIMDEMRSVGDPHTAIHELAKGHRCPLPVPQLSVCRVHLLRWLPSASTDSPQFAEERDREGSGEPSMASVIPAVSLDWQYQLLTEVKCSGEEEEDAEEEEGRSAAVTLNERVSFPDLLVTRDSVLQIVVYGRRKPRLCEEGGKDRVVEAGRVLLPLSAFTSSAEKTRRRTLTVPLVRHAGQREAAFRGAVELEVQVSSSSSSHSSGTAGLARTVGQAEYFKGFDEHWTPRQQVACILSRCASEELHRLFLILASFSNESPAKQVSALADKHGGAKACGLDGSHTAGSNVAVQILGFRELQVPEGTTLYVKGYFRSADFLRTDGVTLHNASSTRSAAKLISGWHGSKPWRGAGAVLSGVTDLHHDRVTFKVGKAKRFSSNETLSVVDVSLADLHRWDRSECVHWVPFYGEKQASYPFLGLLGVKLVVSGGSRAAAADELAIAPGPTDLDATGNQTVMCEIATLLRSYAPQQLRQVQPWLSRFPREATAHAEARQLLAATAPGEAYATLFLRVKLLRSSTHNLLPPEFTNEGGRERLFVSVWLGGRVVGRCRCQVDRGDRGNTEKLPGVLDLQRHGCLRVDVPSTYVTRAFQNGSAPYLELVLEHGTAPATATSRAGRPRQQQQRRQRTLAPTSHGANPAPAPSGRVRANSFGGLRRRSLSLFAPKKQRNPSPTNAHGTGDNADAGEAAPSHVATVAAAHESIGSSGASREPGWEQEAPPVALGRAELSLRGLFSAARGVGSEACRVPMLLSARAWGNRITVLEKDTLQRALETVQERWDGADGTFVLGDLALVASTSTSTATAATSVPPWLCLARTSLAVDEELIQSARRRIVERGPSRLLSRLHYDAFETYAALARTREEWLPALDDVIAEVTKGSHAAVSSPRALLPETDVLREHRSHGAAEQPEDAALVEEEQLYSEDGEVDAAMREATSHARLEQQKALKHRKQAQAGGSPGQNQSISFWTAENDEVMTVSPSNASSIAVDPVAEQSVIPPANTKRSLF